MIPSQTKLMEQCRAEAEKAFDIPMCEEHRFLQTTDTALAVAVAEAKRDAYAQALYDERSRALKVMTDEEIERIAANEFRVVPDQNGQHDDNSDKRDAFANGLRYVRDNGYLAPSSGLTVEEIVGIAGDWFNHVQLSMEVGEDSASELHSRLTAAIKAKR